VEKFDEESWISMFRHMFISYTIYKVLQLFMVCVLSYEEPLWCDQSVLV